MAKKNVILTINALANLLQEKAPQHIRIVLHEKDDSTAVEPEAAHFIKLDGERMGRDLELYNFMATVGGTGLAAALLLEELILPLKSLAPAAFTAGIEFLREQSPTYMPPEKQEEWVDLLNALSE
jgi:hypothetical protein